jgi:hypothetical protein
VNQLHHPVSGQEITDPDVLLTGEKNHERSSSSYKDFNFDIFSRLNLQELLREWRAIYPKQSIKQFLEHTHLDILLTPDQWNDMVEMEPPKLVPSLAVGQHMIAELLRDGVMNSTHFYLSCRNGHIGCFNKLNRAVEYAQQREIPMLRLPPETLAKFRLAVAHEVLQTHLHHTVPDNEDANAEVGRQLMQQDFTKALLAKLQKLRPELDVEMLLPLIQRGLHENSVIVENAIVEMMPDFSLEKTHAWTKSLSDAPELEHSGDMLRFLRYCRGLTQMEVGGNSQVRRNGFASHQENVPAITVHLVDEVKKKYMLSGEELEVLLKLSYPALNDEWLEKQPADKRWHAALRGARNALGLTHTKIDAYSPGFINIDGTPRTAAAMLEQHERKRRPMITKNWEAMRSLFKKREEELGVSVFSPYAEKAIAGSVLALADKQAAFSQEWLEEQPHPKQAGLLLRAIRNKVGISPEKLAEGYISYQALNNMEGGRNAFSGHLLNGFIWRLREELAKQTKESGTPQEWFTLELEDRLRLAARKSHWPDVPTQLPALNVTLPKVERNPEALMERLHSGRPPLDAMCEYFGITRAQCGTLTDMCPAAIKANSEQFSPKAAKRYMEVLCALNNMLPHEQQLNMRECSVPLFSAMPVVHEGSPNISRAALGNLLHPGDPKHANALKKLTPAKGSREAAA